MIISLLPGDWRPAPGRQSAASSCSKSASISPGLVLSDHFRLVLIPERKSIKTSLFEKMRSRGAASFFPFKESKSAKRISRFRTYWHSVSAGHVPSDIVALSVFRIRAVERLASASGRATNCLPPSRVASTLQAHVRKARVFGPVCGFSDHSWRVPFSE